MKKKGEKERNEREKERKSRIFIITGRRNKLTLQTGTRWHRRAFGSASITRDDELWKGVSEPVDTNERKVVTERERRNDERHVPGTEWREEKV